jgi:mRNA interferase HigB
MVILSKKAIDEYVSKHADAKDALNNWFRYVQQLDWSKLSELKGDFPDADYIGNDRYVFNIRGNSYRLIAVIFFSIRTLYIKFIGTHAEYSKLTKSKAQKI